MIYSKLDIKEGIQFKDSSQSYEVQNIVENSCFLKNVSGGRDITSFPIVSILNGLNGERNPWVIIKTPDYYDIF